MGESPRPCFLDGDPSSALPPLDLFPHCSSLPTLLLPASSLSRWRQSSAAMPQWLKPSTKRWGCPSELQTSRTQEFPRSWAPQSRRAPFPRAGCIPILTASGPCNRTRKKPYASHSCLLPYPSLSLSFELTMATYLISLLSKILKWTSENNMLFRLQL